MIAGELVAAASAAILRSNACNLAPHSGGAPPGESYWQRQKSFKGVTRIDLLTRWLIFIHMERIHVFQTTPAA